MKKISTLFEAIIAISTALVFFGSTSALAENMSDDTLAAHIRLQNDRIEAIYAAGDAASYPAMYTQDGILMPAGGPTVTGRAAIKKSIAAEFSSDVKLKLKLTSRSIERHDDTAIEIGGWTMVISPKEGAPLNDHGDYLVIWKRQASGEWLMSTDIYNSNLPPVQ